MTTNTHYFIAVKLPSDIKEEINKTNVQEGFDFQRWVHKDDYHITLAFLGFATQNQLKDVTELVSHGLTHEHEFFLTVDKLGVFGPVGAPRIFWAGLGESKELHHLRGTVYAACEQAGFQLEKRAFHPHITLARKWSSQTNFDLSQLELKNPFKVTPLSFKANEVVLYKTNLLQTPKYEQITSFSLKP